MEDCLDQDQDQDLDQDQDQEVTLDSSYVACLFMKLQGMHLIHRLNLKAPPPRPLSPQFQPHSLYQLRSKRSLN